MLLGIGVLVLDFLAWRFLRSGIGNNRTLLRIPLFILLTWVLWTNGMVPFAAAPWKGDPVRHSLAQLLELVWWLQFAQLATALLGAVLLPGGMREKLFRDVARALTFIAALVAGLGFVIDLPIGGLLATSGAVAIVLGLAVQSTLSDVFSGVVLSATQPFAIGDSVTIGDIPGVVIESNWRATTLLNGEGNVVIVPNSSAAKANIVNQSRPARTHSVAVVVRVASHARPAHVIDALKDAVTSTAGILATPSPAVEAKGFEHKGMTYNVVVFVDSIAARSAVRNQLIDQVYRHFIAHGIPLSADADVQVPVGRQDAVALLRHVEMFRALDQAELEQLGKALSRKHFSAGEMIYEVAEHCPDDQRALYIITSGVAALLAGHEGEFVEIARLAPGDAVGRAGILTGISAPIKLRAMGPVSAAWLPKAALTPIIQLNPAVGQDMLNGLLAFQAAASRAFKDVPLPVEAKGDLLHRLLAGMRRIHGVPNKA
jgi:small-conductance mechanosensitive channel/CRP-like cAMP-binding protein